MPNQKLKECRLAPQTRRSAGFTLVELMVAMVLGLLLIGGVGTVFLSTSQSAATKQGLDQANETVRFSSTMMTRVIRMASEIDPLSTETELIVSLPGGSRRTDCVGLDTPGTNIFRVNDSNQLLCIDVNGNENILFRDVTSLTLAYAEDSDADYIILNSEFVSEPVDWNRVNSVRVTVSLLNGQSISFVATMRPKIMAAYGAEGSEDSGGSGSEGGPTPEPEPEPEPEPTPDPDPDPDPDPNPDPEPDPTPDPVENPPQTPSMCTCSRSGNSDNYSASGGAGCTTSCCRAAATSLCSGRNCNFSFQTTQYCSVP